MSVPQNSVPQKSYQSQGFTLVEIMIVLFIIGLVTAIVLPRMAVMDTTRLRSSARNVAGTIRLTYGSAVMDRKDYRMVFNVDDGSYGVELKEKNEWVEATNSLLAPRSLPPKIIFKSIQVTDRTSLAPTDDKNASSALAYLYFTPGGYVEEAAIYLGIDGDNPVVTVFTRPLTGRCEVVLGEVSREDWEDAGR